MADGHNGPPVVSVVTPVHNGGEYLEACVRSVLEQDLGEFEYVIVENQSSDDTLAVAERLAAEDPRIRVIRTNSLLPIMENWNFALRQIDPGSRYVKVVHADDWLFPDCLSRMVALAERNPAVGVVAAYRQEQHRVTLDQIPVLDEERGQRWALRPGQEVCRATLEGRYAAFGSPTAILLRADDVRRRAEYYDIGLLHADLDACVRTLIKADYGLVRAVLSFTRRHEESLTSTAGILGTARLERLALLWRYRELLYADREQGRDVLERAVARHYRFLARSTLELRPAEFWQYQRQGLAALGQPFSRRRLAAAVLSELADPRSAIRRCRRGMAARHRASAKPGISVAAFLKWTQRGTEAAHV